MTTKNLSRKSTLLTALLSLLLVPALSGRADEKTWTGVTDASWLNAGNWSPSALVTDLDGVLYDNTSTANLSQTLDQNWSVAGLKVTGAPGPITINPGFVLTNTAGVDLSAASSDLTILADYYPLNNGTLGVASGRILTLSNILSSINNTTVGAVAGSGTVRLVGGAKAINDVMNSSTLVIDGGSIIGAPPVRLSADVGSTATVIVTNNGTVTVSSGGSVKLRLGGNAAIAGGTNRFALNGGTVVVKGSTSSSTSGFFVGDYGSTVGILDINNGTIDLTDKVASSASSVIRLGNTAGALGIVNLNAGGRLLTPRIDRISGYGIFNFNGGYLQTSLSGDYFEAVDEVNFLSGGAVIESIGANFVGVIVAPIYGLGGLTKLGSGTLTLAGSTNSFTGPTVVSNGTLAASLPLASSSLMLATNANLSLTVGSVSNATWSVSSLTLQRSNLLTFNYGAVSQPSSTLIMAPSLNATGTNVINIGGAGWPTGIIRLIDYAGTINGGGIFVLGTVPIGLNARLTNDPTTTSIDLVVASGVNNLDWYGNAAYGPLGGGLWDIATTANWNNGSSVYNEYGTGTNQLGDSVRFTPSGYGTVEIATTVRPSSVTISNTSAVSYTFYGPGKISGPTSLTKDGFNNSTILNLGTVNDYTGGTYIKIGNLILQTNNALPTAGLVYFGSPGVGATLTLNGFNQTIAGLISTGSGVGTRRVINGSATQSTLSFNVIAGQTNVYAHTIGIPNNLQNDAANTISIVKNGDGIQTLANAAYNGSTTISAGTLLFNGLATNVLGTVTVQSGGAVGGNGTNASPFTVQSGGRMEPGNLGIGTFTVSNTVTLQGEAVFQISRTNTPNSDKLVANAINLGGTLTVTNVGNALQAGNSFTLFSTNALAGNFNSIVLPALTSGLAWNTNNLRANGIISVVALPRPTFLTPTISGTDLVLSGTGGAINGTFYVITSTNIATPLTNWTVIATNNFNGSGAFSVTNTVSPGISQFFSLRIP